MTEPQNKTADIPEQMQLLLAFLNQSKDLPEEKLFSTLNWLNKWGRALTTTERNIFRAAICRAFNLTEPQLDDHLITERTHTPKILRPIEKVVPAGWFRDYLEYTQNTEHPPAYSFASALSIMGAALGRRLWFAIGDWKIFPNFAIILIGPTGDGKTTAANIAMRVLKAADIGTTVLRNKVTPEHLVVALQDLPQAVALCYAPELGVFLGRQKYNDGMIPLLTDLFDAPDTWSSGTILRGECSLSDVALNFLGCSNKQGLHKWVTKDAFGGGFMGRILFVVPSKSDKAIPFPDPSWMDARREGLVRTFKSIVRNEQLIGEASLDKAAKVWYEDWYRALRKADIEDEKLRGYIKRKPDHLLRLSLCLNLAAGSGRVLRTSILEDGLRLLNWTEQNALSIWEGADAPEFSQNQVRILDVLEQAGGHMAYSALMRRTYSWFRSKDEFKRTLDLLKEAEEVAEDHTTISHTIRRVYGAAKNLVE